MTEEVYKREWCWPLCHEWAKWKDVAIGKTYMDSPDHLTGQFLTQERRCKACGIAEFRKVTTA